MNYLGLHNKPKAEVHPQHMRTGPKEEEEEEEEDINTIKPKIHNNASALHLALCRNHSTFAYEIHVMLNAGQLPGQ